MKVAAGWNDYELLDASDGERLERWGEYFLVRPDPQVIFSTSKSNPKWSDADAYHHRSNSGGGHWEFRKTLPKEWVVSWRDCMSLQVTPTAFKHTGVFPEQAVNWDRYIELISSSEQPIEVLNLFGYTGAASIACLIAGANVTHVDASTGMVEQAKRNCVLSGVRERNIRFITEDCRKFVQREIRRSKKYDAVIMDPPTYGRGPGGEIWRIEDDIFSLVSLCKQILAPNPLFFFISSYISVLGPSTMKHILSLVLEDLDGDIGCDEIGIPISNSSLALPAGSTAYFTKKNI